MRDWLPRIVVLALLAVVLGVPFLLRPAVQRAGENAGDAPARPADRLVVLTPHNEQIRFEFARAFNERRRRQGRPVIEFDWRASGGTSDLSKQLQAEFQAAAARGREEQGVGYDLFFGGGDFEHNNFARGIVVERGGESVRIPLTVPIRLPPGLLEEAFPEPTIGGVPLYHPELHWVGAALSSFGIVYNRDVLAMLGLSEPTTWADLAAPAFAQNVALADPSHSGSIAAAYNVILRRMGWNEGWMALRRVFANARYFTASAAKVPTDVSSGEAAAGMAIDFYGRFQAGAIARAAAGGRADRVGYVDPRYMTAVTPDPISVIRGAPNRELAEEFVAWLLSKEAQALWQKRLGVPGGPERFELRRLPVRRDLYVPSEMALWTDQTDPFAVASPLPVGTPDYYSAVAPVAQAMAIDVHADLVAAWGAIRRNPRHPRLREIIEKHFDAMPAELRIHWPDAELAAQWRTILASPQHARHAEVRAILDGFSSRWSERYGGKANRDRLLEARRNWSEYFRQNYRTVVEELEGG